MTKSNIKECGSLEPTISSEKAKLNLFVFRLEEADYIWRYSWFITRYYPTPPDDSTNWWLDPANSLLDWENDNQSQLKPILSKVGEAYDRPWHLNNRI